LRIEPVSSSAISWALASYPLAEARQLAAAIASRSPSAVRAAKRLLNQAAGIGEAAAAALLMAESREQQALMGGPEQREAVQGNFEKRPARFSTDL
jgi:enoyl-CoA hydratase/carnithine racemase